MRVIGNNRASRPLLKFTHSDDIDRNIEGLGPSDELRGHLDARQPIWAYRSPAVSNWIPNLGKMSAFLN
jgi:hypothetical protein